jgi:hypothetical protein
MSTVFRLRAAVLVVAVPAVTLVVGGLTLHAAVLPLSLEHSAEMTGPEATLVPQNVYVTLVGTWVGHTRCGGDVKVDLRVKDGDVAGSAVLKGLVAEGSAPLPLAPLALSDRRLVFRVKAHPCGRDATYGILTFVSADSARLDLQSERSPITVVLTKVG